ncbi:CaiB/BaiF CoA transferase family protein [Saccharopolyspora phatthalungensis]|uniref:Crotonobetainyl-CoA:carnitine CoA-transferase CaiB-like acyl-CoA transferase n=1 Tax=Saccharopolyspora phatthalungensis TaxID=664693 RepID=A0A840QFQ7_9PSEU|nr:CoA transferase [Saccharopolyspora phatthalungensis]MBB5158917.1 crotonobetainyl-CoA:carnitine CoA-transferase CaiB-like acyl-CoA transferase [Saccharopolyspora phatthalungensis]
MSAPTPATDAARRSGPLTGLKVLDLAHQYAGALAGSMLADFGADVVAVEHPDGNMVRTMLPLKDGTSLWWKVAGRGKRAITLRLSTPEGREIALRLARDADVIIENFRPGTLERWGLGPEELQAAGARAVMLRISGFGQTGQYRTRPGFGSVAEAMSGFTHLTGMPDGPPVFPSTTLADGVTGTFGCLGAMAALVGKLRGVAPEGVQVVDASLVESMFRIIPTQVIGYDQLGIVPHRPGNFIGSHGVLRNLYRSSDEVWFTASAVGAATIRRILTAVEATDLIDRIETVLASRDRDTLEGFFSTADKRVVAWAAKHTYQEIEAALLVNGVVYERVYDVKAIFDDQFFIERRNIIEVPDSELGLVRMQGIAPKLPNYDLTVTHAGPARGHDTDEVLGELGLSAEDITRLRDRHVL